MHIINWILEKTKPTDTKHLKRTGEMPKSEDLKNDNADLRHRVCTLCGRVWELNKLCRDTTNAKTGKKYTYKNESVHYYEDMVKFGKIKEDCPLCLKEKK